MPDETPVETRRDDGLRTDSSSLPAAPAEQPSPLADGVRDPAESVPPAIGPPAGAVTPAPPAVAPAVAPASAPAGTAAANGSGSGGSGEGSEGLSADAAPPGQAEETEDAEESTPDSAKQERRHGSFLRELPVLLVVAFGLALLIKTFLVQAFFIPSGSMERTLHGCTGCSGDRVLVNKLVYRFHDPRPGDVVVFRGPESWAPEAAFSQPSNIFERAFRAVGSAVGVAPAGEKDFVKRIIAVGGQTVQCCDTQGRVVVDGRPLDEPYVFLSDPEYRLAPFGPVKVPEGRLWMMGDHRDESADSRFHISDADQGTIGVSDVIGKAFVIVWPPSRWDTLGTPSTFAAAALPPALAGAPFVLALGVVLPIGAVRHRSRRAR
jgi:signal peptidase I